MAELIRGRPQAQRSRIRGRRRSGAGYGMLGAWIWRGSVPSPLQPWQRSESQPLSWWAVLPWMLFVPRLTRLTCSGDVAFDVTRTQGFCWR
jgi:hypothetical protein